MSEAVAAQPPPIHFASDFDQAYELGKLSGEVRVLKWAVGAALVAILACMGVLYDTIDDVRVELIGVKEDIFSIGTDVALLKTDVATLKTDVATLKTDVAALKTDVATLKTDVATLKTDVATLKTDVATLKTDVATLKTDVATLKTDVADLKSMHLSPMENTHGHYHESHGFPKEADSVGESAPPSSPAPPA